MPLKTISFYGTVSANSTKVLSSKRISRPYELEIIHASFALGINRTVQLYFYESFDDSEPTSAAPEGTNILAEYGQVSYITGDDERKSLDNHWQVDTSGSYLKVYAVNSDNVDHTIDVQLIIQTESEVL
ncbi:MAG: hypothetical protein OEM02_12305 [Desulfobulbaceae bacterium]|nr:hypothetical protein [Desulfobulbaceae bacterium]